MVGSDSAERRQALDAFRSLVEIPEHLEFNADGEPIHIFLFQCGVTDREMEYFRFFTEIESINVGCGLVTDAGLSNIAHLHKLNSLDIQQTGITDTGLVHVKELKNLRYLNVVGCPITDVGVCHLEGLRNLKQLAIDEDGFSDQAYYRLLQAIPGLEISNYL